MNVEVDDIHVTSGLGSDCINLDLPTDEGLRLRSPETSFEKSPTGRPVYCSPLTQFGPFCRTAKSSNLLSIVLEYLKNLEDGSDFNSKGVPLHEAVQAHLMEILGQAIHGWEESCAAIAIGLW